MTLLSGQTLSGIATASDTAQTVTKKLANRERIRHVTDISRIRNDLVKDGERIVDEEYMAYWKALQQEKIGTIIYGRKGKPNRFAWHYSLKSVAQAANDGKDIEAKQISRPPTQDTVAAPAPVKRKRGRPFGFKPKKKVQAKSEKQLEFTLQPQDKIVCVVNKDGNMLEFKVPGNATTEDIQVLIKALKNMKGA